MSLLMGAAIEIGAVAAKSICKLWLKNTVGEDLSSDLIDFFKSKTSSVLAQRQGRRLFEKIGDKISDEILPLLEESSQLDAGERSAVARSVVEAFKCARLTNDLLVTCNLQPIELKKQVLAAYPQVSQERLSQDGLALYDRLVMEVCTYVVDIATQLPGFTEQTFLEVLQREDRIITRIDEVLRELRNMQADSLKTGKADRFEKNYRQAVARNLDVLQLIGVDVSLPHRRHQLSVAYITLSVLQQQIHRARMDISHAPSDMRGMEHAIVSVETTLAASERLLILGSAGAGKTTLLQWIAVRAVTRTFQGALSAWNDLLPFYLRLRRYGASELPQPAEFPTYAARAIIGEMPPGWVNTVLRSGRALVLVDGVDEMAASRREDVHLWLCDLVETYSTCRFVVTSRPHAIEAGWMNHTPFDTAILQDMTLADINGFIDHWHEAVKLELSAEEEQHELPALAEHLKGHIKQTRAIRNLATNPLLCAMLCALNRERRRQLPVNRIELYKACCSLLLERREKDRHIDLSEYPALTYDQKERLLAEVANWMTRKNLSEMETSQVDESFARSLVNMPTIAPDTTGKAVRRLLVERSGIIREPVGGTIDFAHRTFQEFFTALACVNSIKYLVNHAHLDQWREVIILTAGLVRKAPCEQLIRGLLQRGDREKDYRYHLHLLAVSCLETTIELGEDMRKELDQRFEQLIPPKTMDEAKILAAAGELAIKYLDMKRLTQKGPLLVSTSAACVRTLSLIGGDAALDLLEHYASDTRKMVLDELLLGWERFERESYAKRILAPACKNITSLTFSQLTSLEGIEHLPQLAELYLSDTQVRDLSPLASLTRLTTLNLFNTLVTDLSPLASLSRLTTLYLTSTQITDLNALVSLPKLARLYLIGAQVHDLSPLASLSRLTTLYFSRVQVHDLSPLASLPNLTTLCIAHIQESDLSLLTSLNQLAELELNDPEVSDLALLASLSNLVGLYLRGRPISDLSPLASLSNLTVLNLFDTPVTDLSPLASLSKLSTLYLTGTQITDLSPLASLSKLSTLSLPNVQATDLSPLASLSKLRTLHLSRTLVTDLSPLASLSNLSTLSLDGTRVSDLSPLASLSNLSTLSLDGTRVSDLSPLTSLPRLARVYLSHTPVTDLSPLAGLSNLSTLFLNGTPVSDLSPLVGLPKLEHIML